MNGKRKNGEGTWGIKKVGNYTYRFYRYPDGKEIYGKTESEVWKKRSEWEKNPVYKIENKEFSKYTLEEYLLYWLKTEKADEIRTRTYDDYEYTAQHYLKLPDFDLSTKQLGSLTQQMIDKYVKALGKKYSRAVIKKTCAIISLCFDYAVSQGHLPKNYMVFVKIPKEEKVAVHKKEKKFLLPEDFPKLFSEAERINNGEKGANGLPGTPVYGINAYIAMASLTCGTRISEILGLKLKNLHLDEKNIQIVQTRSRIRNRDKSATTKWTIVEAPPKSKNSYRTIPLSDKAVYFFKKILSFNPHLSKEDYICINQNGNICTADSVNKTLHRMLKKSNCSIDTCGTHALRHSYGSFLISTGTPLIYVSQLLGHSNIRVTEEIYIHLFQTDMQKYVDAFDSFSNTSLPS